MNGQELPEPIIFEWDSGNQTKSLKKHGISSQEAEDAFFRQKLVLLDQGHSKTEARFVMYGQTDSGKILFISFTIRNKRVRIISARPADKKERNMYEQKVKKAA